MIKRILSFISKFLPKKKESLQINVEAANIPEAFGYSAENYRQIVDTLVLYCNFGDELAALDHFLSVQIPQKHGLDLSNPQHAAIIGYAFSTAIRIRRDDQQATRVQKVLESFYPTQIKFKPIEKITT